jgi:putative FmdB family regulatory protein
MPIYEYRCLSCGRLNSVFVRSVSSTPHPVCEACGGAQLERAPARFAYRRSDQRVLNGLKAERGFNLGADEYKDPRQIGRWVEKRFGEMGVELPLEARTMIDAARAGELPEPVKDL